VPDFQTARQETECDGIDRRAIAAAKAAHAVQMAESTAQKGKVKFDATINLGHILTFLGFILAGFTAWTTLDKRVTVIEERANTQAIIDRGQDTNLAANMTAIRESLNEIKQQIARINERQDRSITR
jgi:regulator of protease activity HflC (stomatin/prohibitin superfamily)